MTISIYKGDSNAAIKSEPGLQNFLNRYPRSIRRSFDEIQTILRDLAEDPTITLSPIHIPSGEDLKREFSLLVDSLRRALEISEVKIAETEVTIMETPAVIVPVVHEIYDTTDLRVVFDFAEIGDSPPSPTDYINIYPTDAPASHLTGPINNSTSSLEWVLGSGFSFSWNDSNNAQPGLSLEDVSDAGVFKIRYNNAAQKAIYDLYWPDGEVMIHEVYVFEPTIDVDINQGVFLSAPNQANNKQYHFGLEAEGNDGTMFASIGDGTSTVNFEGTTQNLRGVTGHYVFVIWPGDTAYLFYNGELDGSADISSLNADLAPPGNSDRRMHFGRRNPGAAQDHMKGVYRRYIYYRIQKSNMPGDWQDAIIRNNYNVFKSEIGL